MINKNDIFIGYGQYGGDIQLIGKNRIRQKRTIATKERLFIKKDNIYAWDYIDVLNGKKYRYFSQTQDFDNVFPSFKNIEEFSKKDVKKFAKIISIKKEEKELI